MSNASKGAARAVRSVQNGPSRSASAATWRQLSLAPLVPTWEEATVALKTRTVAPTIHSVALKLHIVALKIHIVALKTSATRARVRIGTIVALKICNAP